MEVVLLAAGRGLRFGAAKQFVSVDASGRTLLERTAADAQRAGCVRAVIVVTPGAEDEVRGLFASRPVPGMAIEVAVQRDDDLPLPSGVRREKPWGTAHAAWAARHHVRGPFLLFNADDSYGPNAPHVLARALCEERVDGGVGSSPRFVLLGYPLGTTLSPSGTVSRALCQVDARGRLTALREVERIDARGRVEHGGAHADRAAPSSLVSMNAWGFTPAVFAVLESFLTSFLRTADLGSDECYLPSAIEAGVREGSVEVQVLEAPDRWCGLTWPQDRERVTRHVAEVDAARAAARGFALDLVGWEPMPHGTGLIHRTWRVPTSAGERLLQRVNERVFSDPVAVVQNATAAATRIDDALRARGDEDPRHRLVFSSTREGTPWWRDPEGGVWRCMVTIEGARPADPRRPSELRAAARAFGGLPALVAEGHGPRPRPVLPGFHDTPRRLAALRAAISEDRLGRRAGCRPECDRLLRLAACSERLDPGLLPERFVHNDAKLDNVLVDARSGETLCVIDLDTVMPGLAPHDFGDLVRAAVSGHPRDDADPEDVQVRPEVFVELARGYLEGAENWILPAERAHLVDGAIAITFEQAVRFLADHLAGDNYYAVDDPEHNLRRARAQLRLLECLLEAEDELRTVVDAV